MKKMILASFLALMLAFTTVFTGGCNVAEFDAVLNEVGPAVSTILQIIAIFKGAPANLAVVSKIDADVKSLESLFNDFQAASVANKGSIEAEINGVFATLQADLGTVFSVAQVSDVNTQAKITALVGLIQSAVQIAEAAIPSSNAAASKPVVLDASSFVDSYNKILTAKTGNAAVDALTPKHKIHNHSKFVRVVSLGFAK
jgi:hypothetical protein